MLSCINNMLLVRSLQRTSLWHKSVTKTADLLDNLS